MAHPRPRGEDRRRRTVAFPLIDSDGNLVLWDRRRSAGRRRTDRLPLFTRADVPGFLLMGLMFVLLVLGVYAIL